VANAGSGEIRAFDDQGAHLASWGGQGEGPGEFLHTTSLVAWPTGDSLAVWDLRLYRLTLLAGDGSFGRTQSFSAVGEVDRPRAVWPLPDGNLVLMGIEFPDLEDLGELGGLTRQPEVFAVADTDGAFVAPVGSFPGLETMMELSGESLNIRRLSTARGNIAGQVGEGMVIGSNERFQLSFFSADGQLARIVRVATPPRPLTQDVLDAEIESRAANMPEDARPGYRLAMRDMPVPETLPVFDQVLDDPRGNVWVRMFSPASESGPSRWVVFEADGQILGTMETPEGLEIHQIGRDFVLGVLQDELEVEHVQMWPLVR
jgi:hypothetical protein